MMNNKSIAVGDFITIPAWNVTGQVTGIGTTMTGSDFAQRVRVQEKPEAAGRWYTLEPNEFEFEF